MFQVRIHGCGGQGVVTAAELLSVAAFLEGREARRSRPSAPGRAHVTVAVGHGKKAARHIDAWLRGTEDRRPPKHEPAAFDSLHTWYYADAPRSVQPQLELARRASTFEEVVGSLDERTALYEARRCLSCGNCFSCDNCYGVCPDNAVIKLGAPGERYAIDDDYCKGCGICAAECPCGAIEMRPEEI
jgi:Pyruvate/2-oxoacid:ferredoxin oxidoreductase delta subunit